MKTTLRFFVILLFGIMLSVAHAQAPDSVLIARQIDSLTKVSVTFARQGDFENALKVNDAAEKLAVETIGQETAAYGNVCFTYGVVYYFSGNYPEAEKWLRSTKSIRAKVLGTDHPDYARCLNNLARVLSDLGQYTEAESLLLEAKSAIEKKFGKNHTHYAGTLTNLMNLYRTMGNYEAAEQAGLEAKAIREKILPANHPDIAGIRIDLATLHTFMGRYSEAEAGYLEAKSILEATSPPSNFMFYANCLNNLAGLYRKLGNYKKAEPLYLQTLEIREKNQGREHPDYASTLTNLAVVYWNMGRYSEAEKLCLESKDITEKSLGKEHPDYATLLLILGNLYQDMRRYPEAEAIFLEIIEINAKVVGKEHADYALSLNALATLYEGMGRYAAAEPLFSESKKIYEKVFGKQHDQYASTLSSYADVLFNLGQQKDGVSMAIEAGTLQRALLAKSVQHLSSDELLAYTETFVSNTDFYLSCGQKYPECRTDLTALLFDNILFYKGFLLSTGNRLRRLALSDTVATKEYWQLQSYYRQLASHYTKAIAERDSATIVQLEAQANALEKELASTIAGFGEALQQIKWEEVKANLKPNEAAIEFVHYRLNADSTMYTALMLRPGYAQPLYIPLFEEKQLQLLLEKAESRNESVSALYAAARSGELAEKHPVYGAKLYNLIWRPLDSLLQGVKTVNFSPTGLLHRVNLAALPISKKKVLADRFQLHQMGSTRSLAVKTPESVPVSYTAALYGGILYNSDSTAMAKAAQADKDFASGLVVSTRSSLEYVTDVQRDTTRYWKYLPGTSTEITDLQSVLNAAGLRTHSYSAAAATEESLKALGRDTVKSPDILHIATHGFFFSDPEKHQHQAGDDNVFRWNENPLFRSGLILAGADHAWQTGRPYEGREDGILTAYEISQLNLSNTKLAVLSACETGLGDIKGSEGVYGLQRAFKMAGVDYLMVSLWKVPDERTGEFMNRFYKYWLGGMPIHDAFTKAQRKMRKQYGVYEWGAWMLIE